MLKSSSQERNVKDKLIRWTRQKEGCFEPSIRDLRLLVVATYPPSVFEAVIPSYAYLIATALFCAITFIALGFGLGYVLDHWS